MAAFVHSVDDHNPLHHDPQFAAATRFGKPIVPGMWTASLVAAVLGTRLPGPGCVYVAQSLEFTRPVYFGDTITARVEVAERLVEHNRVRFKTVCVNQRGETVLRGEAVILPPKAEISYTERVVGSVAWLEWSLLSYRWAAEAVNSWTGFWTTAYAAWAVPFPRHPAPATDTSND